MPTIKYVIDPREQLKAFRSIDAAGEELVGIYHSHPVSQPIPSPTDRAEAHYHDLVYVLVSLRTGKPEVFGFHINDDHAGPERSIRTVALIP